MEKDSFDASVGLEFSLSLFNRYRKSGQLQAEVHHIPGIRGRWIACVKLVEGNVASCTLLGKNKEQYSIALDVLIHVDNERGPFEWKLIPLPAPPSTNPHIANARPSQQSMSIPYIVAALEVTTLKGWTEHQKDLLATVYKAVDGKRSIDDIKSRVPLHPTIIEEAIHILLSLKVIAIRTS